MNRRRTSAVNGEATIVAEVFDPAEPCGAVVMLPSYGRCAGDFTEEFGSDLAERTAAAGYQVLLPWPRGFGDGLSTGDLSDVSLEMLAGDVAAVIETEANGPVAVLGHAYGQRVARMLATIRPELVDRLILAAAGGITPTPPDATAAIGTLVFDPSAPEEERLDALCLAFFAPGNDPSVWLDGWDAELGIAQSNANRPGLVERWWPGGGRVPMYVLQGELDHTAPAEDSSAVLAETFPDRAEVVTITDAGHAMLPEQPDQVAAAVLGFLSR